MSRRGPSAPRPPARYLAAAVLSLTAAAAGLILTVVRASFTLTSPPEYRQRTTGPALEHALAGEARAAGFPIQEVTFPTAGGATLRGWVVPGEGSQPGAPLGIVAAHGRAGDRRNLIELARLFRSLGHPTLLFDLREHGLSDGADRGMSLGFREAQDVSAATRYMKDTLGMQRVVAIGQSLGGSSVILAAAHDDSIDAVITDSALSSFEGFVFDRADTRLDRLPFGSHLPRLPLHLWSRAVVALSKWRVGAGGLPDPIEEVGHIGPRPVLVMHGTADLAVRWAHAQGLYDSASQPKELWLVEGAQHMSLLEHDPQEYRRRVAAFLARVAGS